MRLDVISNVHEDFPVLETMFESIPSVDRLTCTGDVVGYNSWPEGCVSEPIEWGVSTVSGNRDRMVTSGTGSRFNSMAVVGADYVRDALSPASMDRFSALSRSRALADDRARFVHGHPDRPDRYIYPDDFLPSLLDDEDPLILGYTHAQGYRIHDDGTVLDPGSVGQPRDGDPRAAYAVVGFDAIEIEVECVNYDVGRIAERIRKVGLLERLASRLYEGE